MGAPPRAGPAREPAVLSHALLQVTQQRLEGLGVVFAGGASHGTTAEAWRATGPISMARQVSGRLEMLASGALPQLPATSSQLCRATNCRR